MSTTRSIYEGYVKFYEGEYTVLYDCSKKVPHLAIGIWKGFYDIYKQTSIDEMEVSTNFIKQKKIIAMISDHSKLKVVNQKALDWLHTNWYPNAAKNGLRLEASLKPDSDIAKLSLNRMLDKAKTDTISSPIFPDFQSAYDFCVQFIQKYKS